MSSEIYTCHGSFIYLYNLQSRLKVAESNKIIKIYLTKNAAKLTNAKYTHIYVYACIY